MSERLKAAAYDQLAALAVAAKMKALRANDPADSAAIVNGYFLESVAIMRRVGLAMRVEAPEPVSRLRRVG